MVTGCPVVTPACSNQLPLKWQQIHKAIDYGKSQGVQVIESKNIYKHFPDAKGRNNFLIKIYFKYQIPDECICFLEKVNEVIKPINTSIEYEIG